MHSIFLHTNLQLQLGDELLFLFFFLLGVERDLCGSSSPTPLPEAGSPTAD